MARMPNRLTFTSSFSGFSGQSFTTPQFTHFHSYPGIDGEWQVWGEWSHCDPSCSCGKKFRYRACTAPSFGGNDCIGDPTETAPCSPGCCTSTVSRIRTSESAYQPSCQNVTSPGWFGSLTRLVLMIGSQETRIPLQLTFLTMSSPLSMNQ